MNQSLLPLRKTLLLLLTSFFLNDFVYSENMERQESIFKKKMDERTYQNWRYHYFPYLYFAPTEEQLKQKLMNDPKWQMYFSAEPSSNNGEGNQILNEGALKDNKKDQKPEGALFAVAIPKRGEVPQPVVVPKSVMDVQPKDSLKQIEKIEPVKQTKDILFGIWIGQYNKLIEYYDPQTKQWSESKGSLKEQQIKLELKNEGVLNYVLPDREGSAAYSFDDRKLVINCEDVRIRGDYDMILSGEKMNIKTSRTLIKDKMRTTLEMDLTKQTQK